MDNDSVQVNGIEIVRIDLIASENTKKVDINNIVVEFNIYESTEQPFMSMDLFVTDALALTTRLPIIGSELIDIEFKVPVAGMKELPFKKQFRVLSIEQLDVSQKARQAEYIIRCFDLEFFNDLTESVQKSYSNMTITEMVKDVAKNYLKIDVDKKLKTTETEGKPTFVVPNLSPSETIKSLFSRFARSKQYQDVSNYTFFSSQDGYHFESYEDMIDIKNKPAGYFVDKYTLREKNLNVNAGKALALSEKAQITGQVNKPDPSDYTPPSESARLPKSKKPEDFLRINDFSFGNKIDVRSAIMSGMLDSTTYYINPTVRTYEKLQFNYVNDFEKLKHLYMQTNKGKGFPVIETRSGEFKNLKGQSKQFYIMTNKGNQSVDPNVEDNRYKHLGFQNASKMMLNSVIIDVTIPGDNTRKVGDLIELSFPEYGATDDVIGEVDAFISGMYLVTAVRHLHNTKHGYSCILHCMKNCFEKSIDEVKSQNQSQTTPKATVTQNTPSATPSGTSTGTTTPTNTRTTTG